MGCFHKNFVLSQDDEDKEVLSHGGEDYGLQSVDSEDSVSLSENSEEDNDDLPWLSDDEYVSPPAANGVDFFQMILDAEHTEQEQVHTKNIAAFESPPSVGLKCYPICHDEICWCTETLNQS